MIQVALFDIDGVLTDGSVLVDHAGREYKSILFDDVDAIFSLKRAGFKIGFITGEKTPFTQYVKKRFKPDFLVKGAMDKVQAFQRLAKKAGFSQKQACYVGDGRKDIPLLKMLSYSFAPKDAPLPVRKASKYVLKAKRGEGVIAEVADYLLVKGRHRHV